MDKPSAVDLLELDFIECRAQLLDLAAFLDRIDRGDGAERARGDHRYRALMAALDVITTSRRYRVPQILTLLSDPTLQPAPDVAGKAVGVWRNGAGDY